MRHAAPVGSTSRIITFQSVSRASVAAQSVAVIGPVISMSRSSGVVVYVSRSFRSACTAW